MKSSVALMLLLVLCIAGMAPAQATQPAQPSTAPASQPAADARQRALDFYRRITVQAYDRVGHRDPSWDDDAKVMLDALARMLAWDYSPTGDEPDILQEHTKRVTDAGCTDPLVLYAAARGSIFFTRKYEDFAPLFIESANRMTEGAYNPVLRCEVSLRAANLRVRDRSNVRQARRDARHMIAAAMAALPKMLSDQEVPTLKIIDLFGLVGDASAAVERDRATDFDPAFALLQQSAGGDSSLALTIKANELLDYSNDARRLDSADAQQQVQQRLSEAASAGQRAWDADNSNPAAAEAMMRIEAARGNDAQAVQGWFERATSADPSFYRAYVTRLLYLEPKYQGSVSQMVDFGRECLATKKWETGIPMLLIEAHLRAAHYNGSTELDDAQTSYFSSDPAIWKDIKAVYEPYLKLYPDSVFHRSRYAQLACWCGQGQTAREQFQILGDRFSLLWFRSRTAYLRQRSSIPQ